MWPGVHAQERPDKVAYVMAASGTSVTYRQLDEWSNQFARAFRAHGLRFGDHVAILAENHPMYLAVAWAALRSGLYCTPVNWHFTATEVAYVLEDSGAAALVTSAALGELATELLEVMPEPVRLRVMLDDAVGGYESFEDAVAVHPTTPVDDECAGHLMLYSSGTTGRPKGIRYPLRRRPVAKRPIIQRHHARARLGEDDVYLVPGAPLYHSAPMFWSLDFNRMGATVVLMERFDAEECLALIERHRVTVVQFVPTMFTRLLRLPPEVRARYDLSSLRVVFHAAAPCPIPVKEQMIAWLGPIIVEYYSSTEANGTTTIDSHEWLTHRGSVGRAVEGIVHILDDDGAELPVGEAGRVFFETGTALVFEYHNDPDKTARARDPRGWSTVGDVGYLDDEGYLYLVDRKDFMIISGGVNIYPQETENVLSTHPRVADAAVFGVPDDEMGEAVKAVVQPVDMADAGAELEQELIEYCRARLARYKCPRSVDFEATLPRQPSGKLYKRLLRDRYWTGRQTRIV